jgi:hypothetical protein
MTTDCKSGSGKIIVFWFLYVNWPALFQVVIHSFQTNSYNITIETIKYNYFQCTDFTSQSSVQYVNYPNDAYTDRRLSKILGYIGIAKFLQWGVVCNTFHIQDNLSICRLEKSSTGVPQKNLKRISNLWHLMSWIISLHSR